MKYKTEWKRPDQVKTFHTSDPKQMINNYLPKHVYKEWTEDFIDESTGEVVSIERRQLVVERGKITQDKLQEIMFAIQSGDIEDVEVCKEDVKEMTLYTPSYYTNYMVEIPVYGDGIITKNHFAVPAQTIPQAIRIAAEFGQMYRRFDGDLKATRAVTLDAEIVPDNHLCIPEDKRKEPQEWKDYFKVQVRTEYYEFDTYKKFDTYYIIASNDVGEAKERISRLLDIMRMEREKRGEKDDNNTTRTIRKAMPFEVDCIVPMEFSELYYEKPTNP